MEEEAHESKVLRAQERQEAALDGPHPGGSLVLEVAPGKDQLCSLKYICPFGSQ